MGGEEHKQQQVTADEHGRGLLDELQCSVRILQPFVRVLRRVPGFPPQLLERAEELDPDERLPLSTMLELLRGAIALTGDEDLGLKAAREISPGDYGALEYAARSAPTWGDAIAVCGRYLRLLFEAGEFALELDAERAMVRLDSLVPLPRASIDFEIAAFHISSFSFRSSPLPVETEAWFTYPQPPSTAEHERTLVATTLRFDAPFNAIVFDRRHLYTPLSTRDPKLHQVIRKHAELLLAELPKVQSFTEKVRDLVAKELEGGDPTAAHVSRALHMSVRTLGRKLEHEGTTFSDLLDDLRRRLALRYVGARDLGLSEIAFLLGFSQSGAFHRAFRRWTGQTPLEYRRERRG